MISLGCPKNLVDSEYMLGILNSMFDKLEVVEDPGHADTVIINTCGFIHESVKESVETILDVARLKASGSLKKLVVVGCLVQRYGYKLMREIPEVDIWIGTAQFYLIGDIFKVNKKGCFISTPTYVQTYSIPRLKSAPFYSAYLKISDGCSHRCSYCLIPKLRGPVRSVSSDLLVEEARQLVECGVKELNIIAQDITAYGNDLQRDISLPDIIEMLLEIKGLDWIRLLYLHPNGVSERLLRLIETEERICPYMDIPIQHANDKILGLMNRGYSKDYLIRMINRIKKLHRKIYLRTTVIVGFPGETDNIFQELCDFIKEIEFDYLGVFVFSPEKGTPAARFKNQVEKKLAEERRDFLLCLQGDISEKKNKKIVGNIIPVLIEGKHPETDLLLVGRSFAMAPDIDGQVIINKGYGIIGKIMPVYITEAYAYHLVGEIL